MSNKRIEFDPMKMHFDMKWLSDAYLDLRKQGYLAEQIAKLPLPPPLPVGFKYRLEVTETKMNLPDDTITYTLTWIPEVAIGGDDS